MRTGSLQALLRHPVGRWHQAISNVWFRDLARGLVCGPPVLPLLAAGVVAGLHWYREEVLMLLGSFFFLIIFVGCPLSSRSQVSSLLFCPRAAKQALGVGEGRGVALCPPHKITRDTLDDARSGRGGGEGNRRCWPSLLGFPAQNSWIHTTCDTGQQVNRRTKMAGPSW